MNKQILVYSLLACLFSLSCNREDTGMNTKLSLVDEDRDIVVLSSNLGNIGGMTIDGSSIYLAIMSSLKVGAKEGQGKILQLDTNGNLLSQDLLPKILLHAPKGLLVRNNKLYINDIDSVKVIDLDSRQLISKESLSFRSEVRTRTSKISRGRLVFQGTELYPGLADIVGSNDSNIIFVAVTNSGNIYRINTQTKRRQKIASTPYVSSLCYHKGTLYASGLAMGKTTIRIIHADTPISLIQTQTMPLQWETQGALKALHLFQDKYLLFSDWGADYVQNGQIKKSSFLLKADLNSGMVSKLNYRGEPKYFTRINALFIKNNSLYLSTLDSGCVYKIQNISLN